MRNPFYYGGLVRNEFFCNRIDELSELKEDILNGINVLIYAPRRFGKTSLVLKALDELKQDNFKFAFLDLMNIATIDEFINRYFNTITKTLNEPTDKIISFFRNFIKLRPNINVSFDSSGNPSFSLSLNQEDKNKTLEEVLNIPFLLAQNGKKIVIVFDEFQEIEHLNMENTMRSVIQAHTNCVAYIFMGSKKHLLTQIFMDKKRAFYKSVKHLVIKEIKEYSWREFIQAKFKETNKEISNHFVSEIIKITKGFPYYTQLIAYELWNQCEIEVNDAIFNQAIKIALDREENLFLLELDNLTQNQKKLLKILTHNPTNLYNEQLLAQYQLKIGSIQVALLGLIKKDIIDKRNKEYYFCDPLFEYYLKFVQKL
ncbi:ATP-binding protein [Helicobacter sp.]|uniref:AAA family ATPase n=1 Tax=Helicobacter sp. TaxID=218 RepID=UPI00258EA165|nr:ATP-binding protein [Helicobacter sp.]MCI7046498.1 ATP-binding protein [Helicobacter sp.]MCI7765876.1 ATP-binding protein [Helicobacter sp.]